LESTRNFTLKELVEFDGKNGKPAYVAFQGKVYDVTDSSLWANGDHVGHAAGENLTMAMEIAPHGGEVMERMKVVGTLTKS
jgi:predicted heme/steroid binding protein